MPSPVCFGSTNVAWPFCAAVSSCGPVQGFGCVGSQTSHYSTGLVSVGGGHSQRSTEPNTRSAGNPVTSCPKRDLSFILSHLEQPCAKGCLRVCVSTINRGRSEGASTVLGTTLISYTCGLSGLQGSQGWRYPWEVQQGNFCFNKDALKVWQHATSRASYRNDKHWLCLDTEFPTALH